MVRIYYYSHANSVAAYSSVVHVQILYRLQVKHIANMQTCSVTDSSNCFVNLIDQI
jgi:hypothetical protein